MASSRLARVQNLGYCNDESDIIHIAKSVKTSEEVVELIDTCIHSAAKLINTIDYIEKEVKLC